MKISLVSGLTEDSWILICDLALNLFAFCFAQSKKENCSNEENSASHRYVIGRGRGLLIEI